MAQYLLSVWHDEPYDDIDFTTPDAQRTVEQVDALNAELQATGAWVFAAGLQPASSANVVRATGTDVSTTDGPFAETKEQMGGFWVIEAPDLDAALGWARKATAACERPVELRPMHEG
ncbi:MAG: YciI family protein [Acidimicrobiales bacterium]